VHRDERERERETFASASGLLRRLRSQKWLYDQQEHLARFMAKTYFWATYLELFNEIWLHFLNFGLILTIGNFKKALAFRSTFNFLI
jgi:hypothetical protein